VQLGAHDLERAKDLPHQQARPLQPVPAQGIGFKHSRFGQNLFEQLIVLKLKGKPSIHLRQKLTSKYWTLNNFVTVSSISVSDKTYSNNFLS
jgi:hypothetical protein